MTQTTSATGVGIAKAIRNYTAIGGLSVLEQCDIGSTSDSSVARAQDRGSTVAQISANDVDQGLTCKNVANCSG